MVTVYGLKLREMLPTTINSSDETSATAAVVGSIVGTTYGTTILRWNGWLAAPRVYGVDAMYPFKRKYLVDVLSG